MDERLIEIVAAELGSAPVSWQAAARGYAGYQRFSALLADGRYAFVKAAVDAATANWLRAEWRVYSSACGPFLPVPLGWHEQAGDLPVLLLEDLSDCFSAPPWDEHKVKKVIETIDELADYSPPAVVPPLEVQEWNRGWDQVAADTKPFLTTGLCSRAWLKRNLPALRDAAAVAPLSGDSLVHGDIRSDNIAFKDGVAVLVDWSWAARGGALVDIVCWLPSLHAEGGPRPETILPPGTPGVGEIAAVAAGVWASVVGLPAPERAPDVRQLQRRHLQVALPWTLRELDLEPLDR